MNEESRLYFDKSKECIKDAQLLLDSGRTSAVVGRCYYAMFHAASAILIEKDIKRHSHQGLISAFGQVYIKTGLIDPKFHKYLIEAFDLRQESDYQPMTEISEKQAARLLERAQEFLNVCQNVCR